MPCAGRTRGERGYDGEILTASGSASALDLGLHLVRRACRLIEKGEIRLDVVAARSGLGTGANLRARLRRETGLSPSDYRRRFGPKV